MSRLDALTRLVTHHKITIDTTLRIQSIAEEDRRECICPIPTMIELSEYFPSQIGHESKYKNGSLTLTLQDVSLIPETSPTHLCLLVNAIDKNGSITVLRDTQNKNRREVSPKKQEGYEVSSHILISLNGNQRSYDALIGTIPGVATNIIRMYLNKVLFEIARSNEKDFECTTKTNVLNPKTGKPIKVLYKPIFHILGTLDQELFNKINKEGLSDVTLVKEEFSAIEIPDVHNRIIPIESSLRIKPDTDKHGVIEWIKKIGKFFKEDKGYQFMKIKYKEDSNTVRQVTLRTDDIRLDALEKTFIKKTIITGFSSQLKDSYDIIEKEIVDKLIEIG